VPGVRALQPRSCGPLPAPDPLWVVGSSLQGGRASKCQEDAVNLEYLPGKCTLLPPTLPPALAPDEGAAKLLPLHLCG
jgi:hypothetical protein